MPLKYIKSEISRRRLKKLAGKGKVHTKPGGTKVKESSYTRKSEAQKKKHSPGMEKKSKVKRGAVKAVHTKGGTYAIGKKGSPHAKSFTKTFKEKCKGGSSGTFKWGGTTYSCKTKKSKSFIGPRRKGE